MPNLKANIMSEQTTPQTTQATETAKPAKPAKGSRKDRKPQAAKAPKGKLAFCLMNRPAAGNGGGLLAAHTSAFLALSGLADGKAVPKATMLRAWGQTAVNYHAANGRIEQTEEGYTLTEFGREFFTFRETGIDKEARAMFVDLLTTGKTSRECPQSFKATKPV